MDKIAFSYKIKKHSIYNFFEYFLLSSIIALTGFEFFFRDSLIIYFVVGPISLGLFFIQKRKIPARLLIFLVLLLILFLLQSYAFELPYSFALTGVLRFFIYFSIASIINSRFNEVYINIIFFLCAISLFFYTLTSLAPGFYEFLLTISKNIKSLGTADETYDHWSNQSQTIIIYVIPIINKIRNCGPFWEPGMFAVFINIALVINLLANKRPFEKKNTIFIITSATTLSTASLMTTFTILLYHYIFNEKKIYSLLFILIFPFIVVPIYNSEYIKGKIETNIDTMDSSYSRFGAAVFHYSEILKSPIIGHGANVNKSSFTELDEYTLNLSPNGLTNIIRVYGIPFSIYLYILLFKASVVFSKVSGYNNKRDALLVFMVMLMVAFSQDVTTRHFYYLLIMFSSVRITTLSSRLNYEH